MLTIAAGIFIASITIAIFAAGARLATAGDGRARLEAVVSGYVLMLVSSGFAFWAVLLR